MARSDVIDSLIATYRDLNLKLRPLSEEVLSRSGADGSVNDVLKGMRSREILASQQIKAMLIAEAAGTPADAVDPSLVDSGDGLPTRVLLSEFGTARESILAAALQRSEEDLNKQLPTATGELSIAAVLADLVTKDKADQGKISRLLSGS